MQKTAIDVDPKAIASLRRAVSGDVIVPGDDGYDQARSVYFSGIDRRPAAVVRAANADGVATVVRFAADSGLPLAVRSGGHSPAGHGVCDDGIVLDLSALRSLDIDADGRAAWVGSGITAGAYTAATAERGLVTGFGDAPSVGVGGITLAGGVGFLHRRFGLTIDNVLAAEIVTADGRIHPVDAETEPDLFWAIRGGGGSFGVVTRFRFRLQPLDDVVGGMMILPATRDTITAAVEAAMAAPDELSGMLNVMTAPPMPFIPPEAHGRPVIMALFVHAGPGAAGERAFAPFRALGPLADMVKPMRYASIYDGAEQAPKPVNVALRPFFVDGVDDAAAGTILEGLGAATAPMRVVQVRVLGGAVARVPADATAFAHRSRAAMVNVAAMYEDPGDTPVHQAWAHDLAGSLGDDDGGAYIGFLGDVGPAAVRAAYPADTWQRLGRIKAQVDPENLFRLNQNIPPA